MKYTFKITDTNGRPISPVRVTATVAQHFVTCVSECIDILNGEGMFHAVRDTVEAKRSAIRTTIEQSASGGRTLDPVLLAQYHGVLEPAPAMEQVVPMCFITLLQMHPRFYDEWENPDLEEFHQLKANEKTSSDNFQLFIALVNKIKIKGVGYCKVEVNTPEQKLATEQKAPAKSPASELSDFYIHTLNLPERTVKLEKKFYLPRHCLTWSSVVAIDDSIKKEKVTCKR